MSLSKQAIFPSGGAKPIGPYVPAIRSGDFLFTAGQIGLDPSSGKLVPDGVIAEARQALKNLDSLVNAAGATLDNAVKTTLYLTNIADFAKVNEIYAEFFPSNPPARSTVQVAALPAGASFEIEAIVAL